MSCRFGLSTHVFHESRLDREHLVEIAAHDFEAIELFATRTHFDYHDPAAIAALAEWLNDTRLELHSVHAPIVDAIRDGRWVGSYSLASPNEDRRSAAIAEAGAALAVARVLPYAFLVVHVGVPDDVLATSAGDRHLGADNQPGAARRSLDALAAQARDVGVRLALEVIPNALSAPAELVRLIEDDLDLPNVGVCLDYGHANLGGDVTDAVEALSGHLVTTHVHDNDGRHDEHLVPFAGTIDWDQAIMATRKVGYDGCLMFEVAGTGDPADVLRRTVKARERLDRMLVVF
ncbi:MAG: sugar phosphate isomerase/epimerase [Acidimicrobiia bacterium]|nr:sugar phosphate isomerase/epimerase [Acidimicrobiia bacterium]